jgi:primosomal protein N' (replication factor Y)
MIPAPMKLSKAREGSIKQKTSIKQIEYVSINTEYQDINAYIDKIKKRAPKRAEMIEYLSKNSNIPYSQLQEAFNVTRETIKKLIEEKVIVIKEKTIIRDVYNEESFEKTEDKVLTEDQGATLSFISELIDDNNFNKVLVHGVTGSGKTEVYIQLIRRVISENKECILLVPEIALTPQMIERFVSRFGNQVAVLHSKLTDGQKLDQWRLIREGKVKIAVGARSAIFAPFNNLGLVIIDEEHEATYKSSMTPRYDAIEVAEALCSLNKCVLVLGTATPSLETYFEACEEKIKLCLLQDRIGNARLPDVDIVDMRLELANGNKTSFSKRLIEEIELNIKNKEQTILFLNKRGFNTFVSCRACGYVKKCPNCDVSMKYHSNINRLKCHYCGYETGLFKVCPECHTEYIRYLGAGTQKIEQEIKEIFPEAAILRMDADTTKQKGSHEEILNKFINKKADILVGTQMIAKGLDIENVTLVGVISADTLLNMEDFRSNERTYQLMEQVSGRAGRGEKSGRVIIQTYNPDHYSLECAQSHNYIEFFKRELNIRRIMSYPPFTRLVNITVSGDNEQDVITAIKEINNILTKTANKNVKILGPVVCSISKINNKYRWRILLKTTKLKNLIDILNTIRYDIIKNNIFKKVFVDMDVNAKDLI